VVEFVGGDFHRQGKIRRNPGCCSAGLPTRRICSSPTFAPGGWKPHSTSGKEARGGDMGEGEQDHSFLRKQKSA